MVSTDIPHLIHIGDNPPTDLSTGSDHDLVTPTAAERDALARVAQLLRPADRSIKLVAADGEAIELPPSLLQALRRIAEILAENNSITFTQMSKRLTVEQAAGLLNAPISFVEHLLNTGEVSFEHVDHQRLIQRDDVLAFRSVYAARRHDAIREMTRLGQEWGRYDFDYGSIKVKRLAEFDQAADAAPE